MIAEEEECMRDIVETLPSRVRVFAMQDALKHGIYKESISVILKPDFKRLEQFENGAVISAIGNFHENLRDSWFLNDSGRIEDASICLQ